jgi:hypothetical protein
MVSPPNAESPPAPQVATSVTREQLAFLRSINNCTYFMNLAAPRSMPDTNPPKPFYSGSRLDLIGGQYPAAGGTSWSTSIQSRELPGQTESAADFLAQTVMPAVRAWAPDARVAKMIVHPGPIFATTAAKAARSPTPEEVRHPTKGIDTPEAMLAKFGWPLSFVTESRHEVMTFYPAPERTLVLIEGFGSWQTGHPPANSVPVSEEAAKQALLRATREPGAIGLEERTRVDYFLGVPLDPEPAASPMPPGVTF